MMFGKMGWIRCGWGGLDRREACRAAFKGDGEPGQIASKMIASSKTMRGIGMELPEACQNRRVSCGEGEKLLKSVVLGKP